MPQGYAFQGACSQLVLAPPYARAGTRGLAATNVLEAARAPGRAFSEDALWGAQRASCMADGGRCRRASRRKLAQGARRKGMQARRAGDAGAKQEGKRGGLPKVPPAAGLVREVAHAAFEQRLELVARHVSVQAAATPLAVAHLAQDAAVGAGYGLDGQHRSGSRPGPWTARRLRPHTVSRSGRSLPARPPVRATPRSGLRHGSRAPCECRPPRSGKATATGSTPRACARGGSGGGRWC